MPRYTPINFADKFERLSEQWSPRVIAEMNDYQFKVARLEGDFVWHITRIQMRPLLSSTGI
jgi:hypothetical protein